MILFLFLASALAASRCSQNATNILCSYNSLKLPSTGRAVFFQTPTLAPPNATGKYPVVILFQGSFAAAELFWSGNTYDVLDKTFNAYEQALVVKTLLDNGFIVVTPDAPDGLFWETNIPPWDTGEEWFNGADYKVMLEIFDLIQNSTTFGAADFGHMFASGISSGGYMTSRAAISLRKYFRACVVESGSYMICGGPACEVPGSVHCTTGFDSLPKDHVPTAMLQGLVDPVVPAWTAELYHLALQKQDTPTAFWTCADCWHQWIPGAHQHVLEWFLQYYDWTYEGDYKCPVDGNDPIISTITDKK